MKPYYIKIEEKYYEVGKEIDKVALEVTLQNHSDSIEKRKNEQIQAIKDKAILNKQQVQKQINELKAL